MPKDNVVPAATMPATIGALKVISSKRNRFPPLADQEEIIEHKGIWLSKMALVLRDWGKN